MSLTLAVGSLISTIFWLPESFRYLYGQKKFEKARAVLQKAADYNKQQVDFMAARFEAELPTDSLDKEGFAKLNKTQENDLIAAEHDGE